MDDHCDAIHKILLDGKSGDSYNISSNNELDNLLIVKTILEIMGKSNDLIEFVDDRPGHDRRYAIDSSKIQSTLNWRPKESFDTGLKKTVKWYLDNPQWWEAIFKKNYALKRLGKN